MKRTIRAAAARTARSSIGRAFGPLSVALGIVSCPAALAATYRCDTATGPTYGDQPCVVGRQSIVVTSPDTPDAAARAAAARRAAADRAALAELERRRPADPVAKVDARSSHERRRHAETCARLALRVKRAHEDASAGTFPAATRSIARARRVEDDYAVECGVDRARG